MSLLVVGSVAFDSIETPFGKAEDVLGGTAMHFSSAASFFSPVNLVGVVGEDYSLDAVAYLKDREVDFSGLETAKGRTFRWSGRYGTNLSDPETLDTQLNVFEHFRPKLPDGYRESEWVFLGNIDPVLQSAVLEQVQRPRLVALDTMNYWIESKREQLLETIGKVDVIIINEGEARQLSGQYNLVRAASWIQSKGPETLVVKRGEYGALLFAKEMVFAAPAYPLETIYDPTGAGDSFAGGFMGYLASIHPSSEPVSQQSLRQAIVVGSVMASFNVESFGARRLVDLTRREIAARLAEFGRLTRFEEVKTS